MMTGDYTPVTVLIGRDRCLIQAERDDLVSDIKHKVSSKLNLLALEASQAGKSQRGLELKYGQMTLKGSWYFRDIGIPPGAALRAVIVQRDRPSVVFDVEYNAQRIPVYEPLDLELVNGADIRALASIKCLLPVSAFRLILPISGSSEGREIFDCNEMKEFNVSPGCEIKIVLRKNLEEIVICSTSGESNAVTKKLSQMEYLRNYQIRVSLYIAACLGHLALTSTMLSLGSRADEPVGEHPDREWCQVDEGPYGHRGMGKCPVHAAAERGQLAVLRLMLSRDVTVVYARDGEGLLPLNYALRNKHRACASFLLTKQWMKVPFSSLHSVPVSLVVCLKRWAQRARKRQTQKRILSNIYQHQKYLEAPLVQVPVGRNEIWLDGFTCRIKPSYPPEIPDLVDKTQISDNKNEDEMKEIEILRTVSISKKTAERKHSSKLPCIEEKRIENSNCRLVPERKKIGSVRKQSESNYSTNSVGRRRSQITNRNSRQSWSSRALPTTSSCSGRSLSPELIDRYEAQRGLTCRQYSQKTIAAACDLEEKSWLKRINKAKQMARISVDRPAIENRPYLFSVGSDRLTRDEVIKSNLPT